MEPSFPFWVITLTALACAAGFWVALWRYHDTLHPLAYLMPMAAFIYVYLPLDENCRQMLIAHFSRSQIHFVQIVNSLFITALIIGCFWGSAPPSHHRSRAVAVGVACHAPGQTETRRITTLGIMLGVVALAAYGGNIYLQGGLVAAYSGAKGGGAAAASGYLRDPAFWSVSAALVLLLGAARVPYRTWYYIGVGVFITPMLLQGFLASRRGPAFMGLVSVCGGWYLTRDRRPSLITLVAGGGALGLVLLSLVAFRDQIYLGSDIVSRLSIQSIGESIDQKLSKETTGNEAFYGANVILSSQANERHYWGKRLATILFIRPIPKQWWPTKYEDVGMSDYTINVGLGYGDQLLAAVPPGAATGFVADLYVEFAWWGLLPCAGIGWYFGRSWRKLGTGGGFAVVNYGCLAAFSVFLVAQSTEAILSRYLVVIVPTWLLWRVVVNRSAPRPPRRATPRTWRSRRSALPVPVTEL